MNKGELIKEYCEQLKKLQSRKDKELAHVEADYLLCELLIKLEFKDVVEAYEGIDKWYA